MKNYSITQYGKPLDPSKYIIDEVTKVFSTEEDDLVLDFSELDGWTFKTGSNCTFKTGSNCTFKTGSNCTFDTGSDCTFKTGNRCTFNTCSYCTFNTGNYCTFNTNSDCTFNTNSGCTFDTSSDCTFETGSDCVVVRRDIFEVIIIPENTKIKLNSYEVKGYTKPEEHKITINGKNIVLSEESFEDLKEQLK